jgi:CHASE3 domain sensor protein
MLNNLKIGVRLVVGFAIVLVLLATVSIASASHCASAELNDEVK